MKRHVRTLPALSGLVALFFAVLLAGCQEQTIPVAPSADEPALAGKKGGGGNGGGPGGGTAHTLHMQGGIETQAPLVVDDFSDNKKHIIGGLDVLDVQLNLVNTRDYAAQVPVPDECSFTCDDPNLDCDQGGTIHQALAEMFVSDGYTNRPGLNTAFDKDDALAEEQGNGCFFTVIQPLGLEEGGYVKVLNCVSSYDDGDPGTPNEDSIDDDTALRTFTVDANAANTVSTLRRYDADGNGLDDQDYLAHLACPLQPGDAFSATFASQ